MVATTIARPISLSVKDHINECVTHYAYEDAVFLAELNYEKEKNEEALLMLADCLFRAHRYEELYQILKSNSMASPRLRYVFALSCYELDKTEECENALSGDYFKDGIHESLANSSSAPFAYNLLSKITCGSGRGKEALQAAEKAVLSNPLLWSSIQEYIHMGGRRVGEMFDPLLKELRSSDDSEKEQHTLEGNEEEEDEVKVHSTPVITSLQSKIVPPIAAPKKTTRKNVETRRDSLRSARQYSTVSADVENESGGKGRVHTSRGTKTLSSRLRGDTHSKSPRRRTEQKPLTNRNSNSLRSTSSTRTKKDPSHAIVNTPRSPSTILPPHSIDTLNMLQTIHSLANIHHSISVFDVETAEKAIEELSPNLSNLTQVILARGRVLLEKADYSGARILLGAFHQAYPHRVEGMEILSTALWHEQDSHSLSALATQLTRDAKMRAESWCVAANSFSLAKQHNQAIDCLKRAIKLQPRFVYSFTLMGCELLELDDLPRAETSFRGALAIRPLDYRAWHGLSIVHQRREEMHLSMAHLNTAISINGQNPLLLCTLSAMYQHEQKYEKALELTEKALTLNPLNVATLYHKARLLYDMRRYEECVETLQTLKKRAPDEANVFFLLGRVYKRMGKTHLALLHFNWASAMDPRGENLLSDLGEPLDDDEDDER